MIDTLSLLLFSGLILYTAIRASSLDKKLPWFLEEKPRKDVPVQKNKPRR